MIIDLAEYLQRRRRAATGRKVRMAVARGGREYVAKSGGGRTRPPYGSAPAVRWSNVLPRRPAVELSALYADASLI